MQPRKKSSAKRTFKCGWCAKSVTKFRSLIVTKTPCCSVAHAAMLRNQTGAASRRAEMTSPPSVRGARWIALTKGRFVLVDVRDYRRAIDAGPWAWVTARTRPGARVLGYAAKRVKRIGDGPTIVFLHRFLMRANTDQLCDHVDRDTLDCRRKNLRVATASESNRNRGKHAGAVRPYASKYKGVSNKRLFGTRTNEWEAFITVNERTRTLGRFKSEISAARAYDAAARKHFGKFACLNFPRRGERSALH
jgi:hypothetical protein